MRSITSFWEKDLGQHQVIQHPGKAGDACSPLCWQFHCPAQACGSFSRSQFINSQLAFNLPINSCKNILCTWQTSGQSRFQVVVKGNPHAELLGHGQEDAQSPSEVLPQPVLSCAAAGSFWGREGATARAVSEWEQIPSSMRQVADAHWWQPGMSPGIFHLLIQLQKVRPASAWLFGFDFFFPFFPSPLSPPFPFVPFPTFFSFVLFFLFSHFPFLSFSFLHSWSEENSVCQKAGAHTQPMCSGELPVPRQCQRMPRQCQRMPCQGNILTWISVWARNVVWDRCCNTWGVLRLCG